MTRPEGAPEITLQRLAIPIVAPGGRETHLSITKLPTRNTWELRFEELAPWFTDQLLELRSPLLRTDSGLQILASNLVEAEMRVRKILEVTNWNLSASTNYFYAVRPVVEQAIIRSSHTELNLLVDGQGVAFDPRNPEDQAYVQQLTRSPLCTFADWDVNGSIRVQLTEAAAEAFLNTVKELMGLRYLQ